MTKRDDGGSAYPVTGEGASGTRIHSTGMSLRDWFAAQSPEASYADAARAMGHTVEGQYICESGQLLLSCYDWWEALTEDQKLLAKVRCRYRFADAMIAARKEGEAGGGDV